MQTFYWSKVIICMQYIFNFRPFLISLFPKIVALKSYLTIELFMSISANLPVHDLATCIQICCTHEHAMFDKVSS